MNRAYRLVWSHTRQIWIAASEIARAHGTGEGMVRAVRGRGDQGTLD